MDRTRQTICCFRKVYIEPHRFVVACCYTLVCVSKLSRYLEIGLQTPVSFLYSCVHLNCVTLNPTLVPDHKQDKNTQLQSPNVTGRKHFFCFLRKCTYTTWPVCASCLPPSESDGTVRQNLTTVPGTPNTAVCLLLPVSQHSFVLIYGDKQYVLACCLRYTNKCPI